MLSAGLGAEHIKEQVRQVYLLGSRQRIRNNDKFTKSVSSATYKCYEDNNIDNRIWYT